MTTQVSLSSASTSSSSSGNFSSPLSSFSLLSWNVLAPIYFRKGPSRSSPSEAEFPELFYKRHGQILEVLGSVDPGIICLQEHWFAQQFLNLYEDKLCRQMGHSAHLLQRSDICWAGRSQDGVATFTRARSWEVVDEHRVEFYHYGLPQDRVALVLILAERGDGRENTDSQRRLAVLCTHLTYPHSRHDTVARAKQMAACLAAVERFVPTGVPTIIVGDLNGPSTDEVARHLRHAGFRNAWEELHGRPCGVTHVDHRGNNFASDHVWIRGSIRPVEARLLPDSASDECQMVRPVVGAAAHLLPGDMGGSKAWGMGHCLDNWCQLSDHRPVLARFEWTT